MSQINYKYIIKHYEQCLDDYGDTHQGVDWPNAADAAIRYKVLLESIPNITKIQHKILDFGCGAAHLLDYINKNKITNIDYSGLDLSEKFIHLCQSKYPNISFFQADLFSDKNNFPEFDYILMNGVFTEKCELDYNEMFSYFSELVIKVFTLAKKGVAFNVMSKIVDYERKDLFHVDLGLMSEFICKNMTRHFVIRNDYGLYEYMVYVYKKQNSD